MTNVRDKVDIKLSDGTAAEFAKRPIEYESGFTLLPGKYTVKFLARDNETGRIGTFQSTFAIPNLNKETRRVATSSVILSARRLSRADALYNISKKVTNDNASPLVQDGQKLIPSMTRVFNQKLPVWVYLQAYSPGETQERTLLAFATLYNGSAKVFQTGVVQARRITNEQLKTIPLNLQMNLSGVPPGRYDLQLTVISPVQGKATFWRASIGLVQ